MFAAEALGERGVDQAKLDAVEQEARDVIEEWIEFALESPAPDPGKATADVYVGWEVSSR